MMSGCVIPAGMIDRDVLPQQILAPKDFKPLWVTTPDFDVYGFERQTNPSAPWVVYLEGDGYAWARRNRLSKDPTPLDPVAAKLAALDTSPNVLWLARPCQYVTNAKRVKKCSAQHWSSHRYSGEIVEAVSLAVQERTNGAPLHLVGFSGGAAIGALLAADGKLDVKSLRTIAGNLDHKVLTDHHRVSPLTGSLNPIEIASDLSNLPQVHYYSPADKTVPESVARSWRDQLEHTNCTSFIKAMKTGHTKGWESIWEKSESIYPACQSR